jgi:hypothetical protein
MRAAQNPKARAGAALLLGLGLSAGLALAQTETAAPAAMTVPPVSSRIPFRGYLSFRYMYVGSTTASTIGNGFRLTGQFRWNFADNKITLRYRSNSWVNFSHPDNQVLESPYENRHIIQTVAVDTNGLIAPGVRTTLGRFFPEFEYASSPVLDGGAASWTAGGFSVAAAAGRMVDVWSGKEAGGDIFYAAQVKYKDRGFSISAGYNAGSYPGFTTKLIQKELPVGLNLFLSDAVWVEAYASYDFQTSQVARAGLSLSWRNEALSFTLLASQWTNPFDQLFILDKVSAYGTWGLYAQDVPAVYRDVRLAGSWNAGGWGLRGSFGWMGGIRSGWIANAGLTLPRLAGIRFTLGGQALKSDFIEFYAFDAGGEGAWGDAVIRLLSQTRYYQWRPRASGFHNLDNFTELSIEYPLGRHVWLNAAGGGYIRQLGNETFKPQVELRLILRM